MDIVEYIVSSIASAYNDVCRRVIERINTLLPTLLNDKENVAVWTRELPELTSAWYDIEYCGIKVADFFISFAEDENHNAKVSCESMNVLFEDEELKMFKNLRKPV